MARTRRAKKAYAAASARGRTRPNDLDGLLEEMDKEDTAAVVDDLTKSTVQKVSPSVGANADPASSDSEEEKEDEADQRYDQFAHKVMEEYINSKTRYTYRLSQRRFVVFLYLTSLRSHQSGKKAKQLLHPNLYAALQAIDKNSQNFSKNVTKVAQEHLMKADRDYRPIDLSKLDATDFLKFLLSLSKTQEDQYQKSYGGHRSALTQLYVQCEVTPTPEFHQQLQKAMRGLKNASAAARGNTGAKLREGKEPLPFTVYKAICQWLLEDESNESVFAHCFLTLTWNLMCRSRNTVIVRREHISWLDDAMQVQFAHTKKDREGRDGGVKRAVFANPFMPEICCVSSVARFLAIFPGTSTGPLFSGDSQYDRFRKILARVVANHSEEIRRMGMDVKDIGVHSIRKGAATYCCNGTTSGASFAAVCNRAGWSMGGTKDRYLQHDSAGDQVVGRTVSGLDVTSYRYAVSPPHFRIRDVDHEEQEDDNEVECYCTEKAVDSKILEVFGGVAKDWILLCWYLLASVLYHQEYIRRKAHPKSRLRGSCLFQGVDFSAVIAAVTIIYPNGNEKNKSTWRIVFTGMTPSSILFNLHQENREMLKELPLKLLDMVVNELNKRELGGGNLTMERLEGQFMRPLVEEIVMRLGTKIDQFTPDVEQQQSVAKKAAFDMLRKIPDKYVLNSKISCLDAWHCWHNGEEISSRKSGKIIGRSPAWKNLKPAQLNQTAMEKKKFYSLKKVCQVMDQAALLSPASNPTRLELTTHFKSPSV